MSEWISVKDRLPPDDEHVLIFIPCYPGISLGSFHSDYGWNDRCDSIQMPHDNKVTHWMPLPETPK